MAGKATPSSRHPVSQRVNTWASSFGSRLLRSTMLTIGMLSRAGKDTNAVLYLTC